MNKRIEQLKRELTEFENTPDGVELHLRLTLSEIVIRNMKLKRWTVTYLVRAAGLTRETVLAIVNADESYPCITAARILFALGVSAKFVEEPLDE